MLLGCPFPNKQHSSLPTALRQPSTCRQLPTEGPRCTCACHIPGAFAWTAFGMGKQETPHRCTPPLCTGKRGEEVERLGQGSRRPCKTHLRLVM